MGANFYSIVCKEDWFTTIIKAWCVLYEWIMCACGIEGHMDKLDVRQSKKIQASQSKKKLNPKTIVLDWNGIRVEMFVLFS